MLNQIESALSKLVDVVWGLPTVLLLVLSGLFLSVLLGENFFFIQVRAIIHAFKVISGVYDNPNDPGEISHFQALTTALSGTIGLGNIGIVAIIIKLGGPGAIFWMFVAGFFGMATKYAESTLAIKYRVVLKDGTIRGGPMYYILNGLGEKFRPLAIFYSFAIAIGAFGISNMFQTNQSADILYQSFGVPHLVTGISMSLLAGLVIIGGIARIGKVTSIIVPLMAVTYIGGCLTVLAIHVAELPRLFFLILSGAFAPASLGGGIVFTAHLAMIQGIRRACFSNEAGLGSAAIAHSAANTNEPVREGVVALIEPMLDTMIICTMSALVILVTGVWQTSEKIGVSLTAQAFDSVLPGFGHYFIPIAATLFAFSTLISWSYYGEIAVDFIFGRKAIIPYKVLFCLIATMGSIWQIQAVLDFSDLMTGMMIFPNLLAIWWLFPVLKKETKTYFEKLKKNEFIRYR
jgi:AGCS family alanine or glycine:cation symporter